MTAKESMVEQDPNELPVEFIPSESDVICGWARQNYHHAGNRMLRDLIQEYVPRYMKASTKTEKGHVIIDIVERIRRESPTGIGLVRQNKKTGRWSYIGLEKAKDKIGHALRKASLEKTRNQSKDKRTPRKQQYPSTDSLTTSLSTSPSPTPVSSVSAPTSPSAQTGRYEEAAQASYHHYDESYQRSAYHHPYHQYPGYHPHYPPPAGGHPSNYEGSASRGYEIYYPYSGPHGGAPHNYPPPEYQYPPHEAHPSSHSSQHQQHPRHPLHHQSEYPPPVSSYQHGAGEAHLYSPVSHSPISHGH